MDIGAQSSNLVSWCFCLDNERLERHEPDETPESEILNSKDIVHDYDPYYGIAVDDYIANTDCKLLSVSFQEIESALIKTGTDEVEDDDEESEEEDQLHVADQGFG